MAALTKDFSPTFDASVYHFNDPECSGESWAWDLSNSTTLYTQVNSDGSFANDWRSVFDFNCSTLPYRCKIVKVELIVYAAAYAHPGASSLKTQAKEVTSRGGAVYPVNAQSYFNGIKSASLYVEQLVNATGSWTFNLGANAITRLGGNRSAYSVGLMQADTPLGATIVDYVQWASQDNGTSANRPVLRVSYYRNRGHIA